MTKTNSANYTAAGTQFPLATDALDPLTKEDIFKLQKALEEHTHDATRGLAIRRVNTASTPGGAGQIQIDGDEFVWWAGTSGLVYTAAALELAQTWAAQQRFNSPLLLPDVATPSAPGASLNVLYFKGGLLYRRSGASGGETPVGTPPAALLIAKSFDTDGTPGTWAELKQVTLASGTHKDWVLAYDPSSTEQADFSLAVPPGYAGTPITFYIHWKTTATSGNAAFRVGGLVSTTGGDMADTMTTLATISAFAAQGTASRKNVSALPWTASLPVANDWIQGRLYRVGADGTDTLAADADVLAVTVAFG